MDAGLFKALFEDKSLGFNIDGKQLEASIEKHREKGSASKSLFGGLELFENTLSEGKLPTDKGTVPNDDGTMNDLREGGAGAGGFGGGRGSAESGDPKVEDKVEEGAAAGGTATVPGGKKVAGVATAEQGDVKVAGVVSGKDTVKEDTAGVAKTPGDKETAGVAKAGTGDVKVSDVVGSKKMKEDVGAEKVLGEFSDESAAKALQSKTTNSKMSQYKTQDGKDVWRVTLMDQGSGMAESCEQSFTKAMSAYQKVVVECRKKIREEKDPLNAGLVALKNTIQNMLNFHSAGDTKQAVEYATLATKQAADIGANLQTMASAEEAAAGVHKGGMGGAMDTPADGVSDAASATADSLPTGTGGEVAPAGEEMNDVGVGGEDDMDIPEEDVEVPEKEYTDYEKEYESIEEAHLGFKKLVKKIEGGGKDAKAAKAIAASVGRKKFGKEKFQAMAKKGKETKEGKLPANAGDPNSDATMNDLREKKVQEAAEKAYLVLRLKEKTSLTDKEKSFIESVEKEVIDEKLRAEAKVVLEKMLKAPKTTTVPANKDKVMNKKGMKDQEKELKSAEKKG